MTYENEYLLNTVKYCLDFFIADWNVPDLMSVPRLNHKFSVKFTVNYKKVRKISHM